MASTRKHLLGTGLPRTSFLILAALLLFAGFQMVGPAPAMAVGCATGTEVVGVDKRHYSYGETVQITGSGYGPQCPVTLEVYVPGGAVDTAGFTTDNTGAFTGTYTLANEQGEYILDVLESGNQVAGAVFTNGPVVLKHQRWGVCRLLEPGRVLRADGRQLHLPGAGH